MMLDIFSAIVIMIPILLPIAMQYGIHPIHLGILFLANMQLGYFTPPVGMNLFIASFRFKKPVTELYIATIPFFFILLARSEEHTSELQSRPHLVCRLLLEKKKNVS